MGVTPVVPPVVVQPKVEEIQTATEVMEVIVGADILQGTTRNTILQRRLSTKESVPSWETMSIPTMIPDKLKDIPRLLRVY